jgi:hypothetical protein
MSDFFWLLVSTVQVFDVAQRPLNIAFNIQQEKAIWCKMLRASQVNYRGCTIYVPNIQRVREAVDNMNETVQTSELNSSICCRSSIPSLVEIGFAHVWALSGGKMAGSLS